MTQGNRYHESFQREKVDKLNRYISGELKDKRIPGLGLTLVKEDEVVFSRGYGYRDVERSLPASDNTLFGIGSVTKSFTAVAILQLAEKGKLKLDDPVTSYVEDYRVDSDASKTTISHLLSHSSGFPTLNAAEILLMREIGKDSSYIPMADRRDFFDLINSAADERVAEPGKQFFYWNEGYTMLGYIIEKLSGLPFRKYVEDNILRPLGMKRSTLDPEAASKDSDAATGYFFDGSGSREPVRDVSHDLVDAAGGLICSSLELSMYLRMWMGSSKHNGGVLSQESIRTGIEPRIKTPRMVGDADASYAYGWLNSKGFLGHNMIAHSGSTGVFSAHLAFLPEFNAGAAVTSNNGDCPTAQIASYALALLVKGLDAVNELPFVHNSTMREQLKGEYQDFRGYTKARVFNGEDGLLNMRFESDEMKYTVPLILEKGKVFTIMNDTKMPVDVKMPKNGRTEVFIERHRLVRK